MVENRDELLQHYHDMRHIFLDAIAGLSDEQLTEATIDGWSVKDHMTHIALWDEVRAIEVERISEGWASALRMNEAQADAFNDMSYLLRKDLSLDQARWEYANTRRRLLEAIAAANDRALDGSLYGEAGLRSSHEEEHAGWIRRWRGERGY